MEFSKKIGFIGCGNMATAIMSGMVQKGLTAPENINAYDIVAAQREKLAKQLGVNPCADLEELVRNNSIIFFCIKPNVLDSVLQQLCKMQISDKTFVSIVAGWSSVKIKNILGDVNLLRIMPNTPLMAGEGMTVFETPYQIPAEDEVLITSIFEALGKVSHAPLKLMDAVTAVSGSGPAYAYLLIDAMADAGVYLGLPHNQAVLLAAQTVLGAAKNVLDTGKHPMELKDNVCSPGGTTIAAVKCMEEQAFKGIMMQAVEACAKKSKELA